FRNRRRTTAKVLHFDGTDLGLYIKRLARGRFAALWEDGKATSLSLTRTELELFLQGSLLVGKVALAPAPMSEKELVVRPREVHRYGVLDSDQSEDFALLKKDARLMALELVYFHKRV